ncbi:ensconsin isoform X2 [Periophthalmus magnuspinnatus]|uniref:ensconsin isoform X2 n=1 Tax=Periophthalmus magnuspinnatus TaxID=409849 RepID=UPI00243743BA|nr:ensconsin isoform X2 [Periophthalmus magnuspinnatus]
MADGATTLKGLRAQMAAAAQAQAEERRSLTGTSPVPAANTVSKAQGCKPVIDGATLRIDDKLRVARERREEADKQQALRESQIMERERKAKIQVERQMEERQKKVEEQRKKEEQKRLAAEEKRKQKQEEEKEHYKAVMLRTLERSQRVDQRQNRWSWGGQDSDGRAGDSDASASSPVTIVISSASPEKPPRSRQVDKRSTSTTNLKQLSEAGINKRLSSSSSALGKSPDKSFKARSSSCNRLPSNRNAAQVTKEDIKKPKVEQTGRSMKMRSSSLTRVSVARPQSPAKPDKGTTDDQARRPPASPVDEGLLSRLLTPTQASLARSKSAAALSAEGTDSPECHLCPRSASASPLHPPRGPVRSRSSDRHKSGMSTSVSADGALDSSMKNRPTGAQRPASPSNSTRNRSPSPAPSPAPMRTPSPGAAKQNSKTRPSSPGALKQRPPSPQPTTSKPPPIQKPALTPTGPPTLRKRDSKSKDLCPVQPVAAPSPESSKAKEKDDTKGATGTNSAAEAAKILAENRRLMREQKEKEEQLRIQREEEERVRLEEEKRLAEEARLKRLEEEKLLAEERRIREEEEARQAEEERVRAAAEEAQRQAELQKEKEEAEARALEDAKRVQEERERVMQQNQQERMERKKRIEEIMKRTRKGDQSDSKKDEDKDINGDVEDVEVQDQDLDQDQDQDQDCESNDTSEALAEDEKVVCDLSSGEPTPEEPVCSVNGSPETEDKENSNGLSTEELPPEGLLPNTRVVEGSEFVNEQNSAMVISGLNGKSNQWSFEGLIDLNGHNSRPLMDAEDCNQDCNQVLLDCGGTPDGNRVIFEDKTTPVNTIHSSNQPIEALSSECPPLSCTN